MNWKFLTPKNYGALDYAAATALIAMPYALGFEGLAFWLSVAGGAGLVVYSLLTDYAFGVATVLPFRIHLLVDSAAAVVFAVSPFVFGWQGLVLGYYLVMAGGVLAVVIFSASEDKQSQMAPGNTAANLPKHKCA